LLPPEYWRSASATIIYSVPHALPTLMAGPFEQLSALDMVVHEPAGWRF
jgi:hypothetical protein